MTHAAVVAHEARLKAGKQDAPTSKGVEYEEALHNDILAECRKRGWYVVRSRMDVAATNNVGCPDFIIAAENRTIWVEAKAKKRKPTPKQLGALQWLNMLGHKTAVVRNLDEFLKAIEPNNGNQRMARPAASPQPEGESGHSLQ